MKVTGFLTGALGLIALEVVTSSPGAANRTAALPTAAAGLARRLLDADVALLPNWHDTNAPLHQATGSGVSLADVSQAAQAPPDRLANTPPTGMRRVAPQ